MSFAVTWKPDALDELARVWVDATDRDAVTAASHRVEQLLGRDPLGQGESRSGNARVMFDPPLAVVYRVNTARRRVTIFSVRPLGRA
jgi:plasmid stabilization system protein ParE